MKNPFKQLYRWFLRLLRKKQFEKRELVYDDVIGKLAVVLEKKKKDQDELKEEIVTYMRKKLGYDAESKYIPRTIKNDTEIKSRVHVKFKFRMDKVGIELTDDLKFICI